MKSFAMAILASTFLAVGAAPALASGDDQSDLGGLSICENLGEHPSNDQVRDCVSAAAHFVQAHRGMIEQAVRDVRANEAAIRNAQQEIEANRAAIAEAQRDLRSEMDAIHDAVREVRQNAERLRDSAEALRDAREHASPEAPPVPQQTPDK